MRMKITIIAGLLTAAALLGAAPAHADSETNLQYEICTGLDNGMRATSIVTVLMASGYSTRQAADIVHDAVMDHCIEHYEDVWG